MHPTLHSIIPKILHSNTKTTLLENINTPQTLNIINLTSLTLTPEEERVLQLGLGFCPSEPINIFETIKDLYLFAHNLIFRFIFDKDRKKLNLEKELTERTKHFSMQEFRALRDLILLYEEGTTNVSCSAASANSFDIVSEGHPVPDSPIMETNRNTGKFKIKSRTFPDLMICPSVWAFLYESIKSHKKQQWA